MSGPLWSATYGDDPAMQVLRDAEAEDLARTRPAREAQFDFEAWTEFERHLAEHVGGPVTVTVSEAPKIVGRTAWEAMNADERKAFAAGSTGVLVLPDWMA